uniref:Uncharacterized protein n=1 Tax=Arundo donax TaxID=35708 RepID=A0A0A9G1K1_ARUDO
MCRERERERAKKASREE